MSGARYAGAVATDPTERWTRLRGRHLTILGALVDRQMDALGGEFSRRRLSEVREILAHVTAEELAELQDLLDAELLRRWSTRPEEDREGPPDA